jgi:hypothetical protein
MSDFQRQAHYGQGRQAWDDILDEGWAPEFAAGNILKYLRRTKEPEHSLESARWYYARLTEMMRGELLPATITKASAGRRHVGRAAAVLVRLGELLTDDEKARLG